MRTIAREHMEGFAKEVLDVVMEKHAQGPRAAQPCGAFVIFLRGELGAGKTTFMQAFARALGVTQAIHSPTFALMKSYPISHGGFTRLVHIDAYRFESPQEFTSLAPEQFLYDPHAIVCIEWPERVEDMLPQPDLDIRFSHTAHEQERGVVVETGGQKNRPAAY